MAYATISKPRLYFNTKLYTGTGSSNAITGVGFQPDFTWIKDRDATNNHSLYDAVRGVTKVILSNATNAETTYAQGLTAFGTDGFTVGTDSQNNTNGNDICSWNWKAGGASPAITYTVKVVSDSGNKYRFNDFSASAVTLNLQEGGTYTFDQSDSSNATHPLRFYTASDKTGGEYTTGVTTTGTPGSSGAKTVITVAASAPTLYYQCSSHAGMGGQANTNSTFGSTNFSGSVESIVSASTASGFSVVKYTGDGTSGATFGHGLDVAPRMVMCKGLGDTYGWKVWHADLSSGKTLNLHNNNAEATDSNYISAASSTNFTTTGTYSVNESGNNYVAYCFAEKTGFSKLGKFTGNGSTDGAFVYTGFKPAFVMLKYASPTSGVGNWGMHDGVRDVDNPVQKGLIANGSAVEDTHDFMDMMSNGFKLRSTSTNRNESGSTYIYMAFAEEPIVSSNGVPATAR